MSKIKYILFLVLCAALFVSCEEEDRTYNGPDYVEFSPDQFGQTFGTDGLTRKTGSIVGLETFVVQQIAYLAEKERTVNFRIADVVYFVNNQSLYLAELPDGLGKDDYKLEYTTMKEGLDYSFDGVEGVTFDKNYLKGSVKVGSMESFGYIITNILQKSGKSMFIVLDNSEDFMANKYSRILKFTAPQP